MSVNDLPADMRRAVKDTVSLLVNGRYDELESLTNGVRLSATELETGIREYGRRLVIPPPRAYANLDVSSRKRLGRKQWSVRFDLWTAEEGRSDLTIELTLTDDRAGSFILEIDDLHVL